MRAGEQVTPALKLVRPLGHGSMGTVWIAEHSTLGVQVAFKVMTPDCSRNPELFARFQQEALATAQVKSPHVVQVLDHGMTADRVPYIVMELLEGETLRSRMERCAGQMPVGDVVRLVAQTASALGRAHQLGVVHRDIKPDNLFLIEVDEAPFVKVLDFGIAKHPSGKLLDITWTSCTIGTPLYMSPEQLVSAKYVDYRTDLWALAAVAYQALTGRPPYQGASLGAQTLAVHEGVFAPPSSLRPGLPQAVDAWAVRALKHDPAARFASARELAEVLAEATRPAVKAAATGRGERPSFFTDASVSMSPSGRERATRESRVGAGRIQLVQGNIVQAGTEAIVNASDEVLSADSGAALAIHGAAGPVLQEMTRRVGRCATGEAFLTGPARLPRPTRFIIHAVGPRYDSHREGECAELLRGAYLTSLRLAEANNIRSIAFPAISTGSFGYPIDKAARIAVDVAAEYLEQTARSLELITFVLYTPSRLGAFAAALDARVPSAGRQV